MSFVDVGLRQCNEFSVEDFEQLIYCNLYML